MSVAAESVRLPLAFRPFWEALEGSSSRVDDLESCDCETETGECASSCVASGCVLLPSAEFVDESSSSMVESRSSEAAEPGILNCEKTYIFLEGKLRCG